MGKVNGAELLTRYNSNTKGLIEYLAGHFNYRKLPKYLQPLILEHYNNNLNGFDYSQVSLHINKVQVATKFKRIVIGDYGAYVELSEEDLLVSFNVKSGQEWRLNVEYLKEKELSIKYVWLEFEGVKVYKQLATVDYADYKANYYYISVLDFDFDPYVHFEKTKLKNFKASSKLEGIEFGKELVFQKRHIN